MLGTVATPECSPPGNVGHMGYGENFIPIFAGLDFGAGALSSRFQVTVLAKLPRLVAINTAVLWINLMTLFMLDTAVGSLLADG